MLYKNGLDEVGEKKICLENLKTLYNLFFIFKKIKNFAQFLMKAKPKVNFKISCIHSKAEYNFFKKNSSKYIA